MSALIFDGDEISHNSYLVLRGYSQPRVITYPRTIGGLLQESGIIQKTIQAHSYLIPPPSGTRLDVENFFHLLNEKLAQKESDITVNGNTYLKANCRDIEYGEDIVDNYIRYVINFELNSQQSTSTRRQLSVPGLENYSRGRKLRFDTEDGKSFHFWHNFDNIRKLETQISFKTTNPDKINKVVRVGGFERIKCIGWIIGPDVQTRRNLEAYFYNIMNGPIGMIGNLYHDGVLIAENCFLEEMTHENSTAIAIRYELTFLASVQC